MNARRRLFMLGIAAATFLPVLASAHSLDELQQDLHDREEYFQAKNEPAPSFALEDAEGNPVGLAELKGKAVVLYFVYASCPDICPLHSQKIAEVQEMVKAGGMEDRVQFVAVTTDPVRDTAEVLKAHGETQGLRSENWTFLTSAPEQPEDTTRKLAEAFGHSFTVTDESYQVHGTVTHVIDPNGVWAANFHGLGFEATNLVLYLNALVNDQHGPAETVPASAWDRFKALFRS